jgi:hypothetical protein
MKLLQADGHTTTLTQHLAWYIVCRVDLYLYHLHLPVSESLYHLWQAYRHFVCSPHCEQRQPAA